MNGGVDQLTKKAKTLRIEASWPLLKHNTLFCQ